MRRENSASFRDSVLIGDSAGTSGASFRVSPKTGKGAFSVVTLRVAALKLPLPSFLRSIENPSAATFGSAALLGAPAKSQSMLCSSQNRACPERPRALTLRLKPLGTTGQPRSRILRKIICPTFGSAALLGGPFLFCASFSTISGDGGKCKRGNRIFCIFFCMKYTEMAGGNKYIEQVRSDDRSKTPNRKGLS